MLLVDGAVIEAPILSANKSPHRLGVELTVVFGTILRTAEMIVLDSWRQPNWLYIFERKSRKNVV